MNKNFIVIEDYCEYCNEVVLALIGSELNVDILHKDFGDPRIKRIERFIKPPGRKWTPGGMIEGVFVQGCLEREHFFDFIKNLVRWLK